MAQAEGNLEFSVAVYDDGEPSVEKPAQTFKLSPISDHVKAILSKVPPNSVGANERGDDDGRTRRIEVFDLDLDLELGDDDGGTRSIRALDLDLERERGDDDGGARRIRANRIFGSAVSLILHAGGAFVIHGNSPSNQLSGEVFSRAGYLIALSVTVAGVGLHRFTERYSVYVVKAGTMGCSLSIVVAYTRLLPPWLAWSAGAISSALLALGIAFM